MRLQDENVKHDTRTDINTEREVYAQTLYEKQPSMHKISSVFHPLRHAVRPKSEPNVPLHVLSVERHS